MKYSEKLLEKLRDMDNEGQFNTSHEGSQVVEYKRNLGECEANKTMVFYYKFTEESKILFGNAKKTHVFIDYSGTLDEQTYTVYNMNIVPKEIVAAACGYESFEQIEKIQNQLPSDEKDRISFMISGIVPITEEEYRNI